MLLFGGAVLKAGLTDIHLRYVKEGLRPFLLIAGALLVVAAVMTLYHELRPTGDAEHAHHEPRVGWLLILPVIGLLLVSPPALGSYAAGQAGTALAGASSESEFGPLPPGDPVPLSLMSYASRAVFDEGRSLSGRNLRLIGFVSTGPDGRPLLARITLACCAADGRPVKVGLTGAVTVGAPADSWVQVIGRYHRRVDKDPVNNAAVPYLEVTDWQRIPAPRKPYE